MSPLVPERDVLEGGGRVGPHDAGEAGDVLRKHGVALVRHGGGAFLPCREILLRLQHLGALQVTHLDGEPLQGRGDDGEHREEHRVPVARDHLGRNRLRGQPELGRDVRLHARIDVGEGTDRAGDRAGGDLGPRRDEPRPRALELGVEARELHSEGRRLGVDPVRAADGGCELMLAGAPLQRGEQRVHVRDEKVRRAGELHGEARVENVGRGQPRVDVTRLGADDLGKVGQEGDHVVFRLALDRVDAPDIEHGVSSARPHGRRGLARHLAKLRHRVERVGLDLEPDAEPGLRLPERDHLRAAVAGDHAAVSRSGRPRRAARFAA